ncbi:MAG TPA: PepSY-associated TM helix domain-containing protein [Vicinamibacterales bacterium]|nr:PepSY-associated TM helix domain-containing protein [Vicinamibacterales bacterium]
MIYWAIWIRQPQTLRLRRAIFQIHLWTGIVIGLYIIAICVSGSVLVYRNELYRAFSPTGENPSPLGFKAATWLLDFHDNLLGGTTGRRTNGVGAALLIVLGLTGLVVWWPGVQRWRRSLLVDVRANWRQFNWSLHSALGIWFVAFILMWGITGLYLSYPAPFDAAVEYLQPFDAQNPVERFGDRVLYWLGYAHFGRFGGRIPGCGRGTCNEIFKAVWAAFGLVPFLMAVTGATMWWNRQVSKRRDKERKRVAARTVESRVGAGL